MGTTNRRAITDWPALQDICSHDGSSFRSYGNSVPVETCDDCEIDMAVVPTDRLTSD